MLKLTAAATLFIATLPASTFTYTDWAADTLSTASAAGSAIGALAFPTPITVTYSGDVVQTTQVNNIGTNFYSGFPSVYTNAIVSNFPLRPDMIALAESPAYTNTISFSSPVFNPVLDIVSLGQPSSPVSYLFNRPFTILSQGAAAFGGCSTCLTQTGNTLTGTEGAGVVQFSGVYNSITWTTIGSEYWNGFTVGAASPATILGPEPGTWLLLLGALPAMALLRRRKTIR